MYFPIAFVPFEKFENSKTPIGPFHKIVLDFLHAIGVPPDIAEADAEGIEHHVSEVTLKSLATTTEILNNSPKGKK